MEDDSRNAIPKKKNTISNTAKKKSALRSGKASNTLSFLESFKNEWALFWAGIHGENETDEILLAEKVEALEPHQIKEITKSLSEQKRVLNQKLESIAKEMDLNQAKLHSVKISGLENPEIEKRMNELSDLGHQINSEIGKIDARLKLVRIQDRAVQKMAAAL